MSTIKCPFCKEDIKSDAIKCKHCGSVLSQIPVYDATHLDTVIKQGLSEHYQIISTLGKGGMATVYRAIQRNLNREVALKVVHPNLVHDQEFIARFHREAQVSASLKHPNIVTIYDVGSINGIHFISMELLEGKDLYSIIQSEKRLSVKDMVLTISPIANALGYAHSKKLVHRDIKSSNIFVTKEGRPVLTDFGIAHLDHQTKLTQAGAILGTPDYMSPEQADGGTIDGRSDIFSLGIVMYECLTGQLPFKSENPLSTIHAIINKNHVPASQYNKGIPKWLVTSLNACLEKKVNQRFKTAFDLEKALNSAENGGYKPSNGFIGAMNRNKSIVALGSVAIVLIVALFSIVYSNDTESINPPRVELQKDILTKTKEVEIPTSDQTLSTKEIQASNTISPPIKKKETEEKPKLEMPQAKTEVKVKGNAKKPNKEELLADYLKKAKSDFNRSRFTSCISYSNKALQLENNNSKALELKLKAEEAKEAYNKMANESIDQLKLLAGSHYEENNLDSALFYYEQALQKKRSDKDIKEWISSIEEELNGLKGDCASLLAEMEAAEANNQLELAIDKWAEIWDTGYRSFEFRDKKIFLYNNLAQQWIHEAQQKMILVDGGEFQMGSNQSSTDQRPQHSVNLQSFHIDTYEVTVEEYRRYCKINNVAMPDSPSKGLKSNSPVVNISWTDAYKYAKWVGKRLPTEAEWEFAAKGGNQSQGYKYSGSNIASQIAAYNSNKFSDIKTKKANELGIYDMSGCVWEWCQDYYASNYYQSSPTESPQGPNSGTKKVVRGGSYDSSTRDIQIKNRNSENPYTKSKKIGFRCVKDNF